MPTMTTGSESLKAKWEEGASQNTYLSGCRQWKKSKPIWGRYVLTFIKPQGPRNITRTLDQLNTLTKQPNTGHTNLIRKVRDWRDWTVVTYTAGSLENTRKKARRWIRRIPPSPERIPLCEPKRLRNGHPLHTHSYSSHHDHTRLLPYR